MSVPEPERHSGRLEVHVKAHTLAAYTAEILANRKIFNTAVDVEIINRIRCCAYDIYAKSWAANKIRAETNNMNRAKRYELQ